MTDENKKDGLNLEEILIFIIGALLSVGVYRFVLGYVRNLPSSNHNEQPIEQVEYATNNQNNQTTNINTKPKSIDYHYSEIFLVGDRCEGLGCVIADYLRPGGKKRVFEKYNGKQIEIEKYYMGSYQDNYDTIIYREVEGSVHCHMSLEESDKLQEATKGKRGIISIYGTLNVDVSSTSMYIQPCYFKKIYKCVGEENGALCLDKASN